jgi:acyl-CoA thioester hydrolase
MSSAPEAPREAPLALHREAVRAEWIDYNGHMNVAYYVLVFDHATDAFLDHLGLDGAYRAESGCSTFALESHLTYERELAEGDPLEITTQLLDFDERRIHFFHRMLHAGEGYLAATTELLSLHVDLGRRRAEPMSQSVLARLRVLGKAHARLPRPPQAGRAVGLRAGRPASGQPSPS